MVEIKAGSRKVGNYVKNFYSQFDECSEMAIFSCLDGFKIKIRAHYLHHFGTTGKRDVKVLRIMGSFKDLRERKFLL